MVSGSLQASLWRQKLANINYYHFTALQLMSSWFSNHHNNPTLGAVLHLGASFFDIRYYNKLWVSEVASLMLHFLVQQPLQKISLAEGQAGDTAGKLRGWTDHAQFLALWRQSPCQFTNRGLHSIWDPYCIYEAATYRVGPLSWNWLRTVCSRVFQINYPPKLASLGCESGFRVIHAYILNVYIV